MSKTFPLVSRSSIACALAICRGHRAILPIAKLGRLARNVHFISGLMETGVPFVATASPFMLHVYAAMAEAEGIAIIRASLVASASNLFLKTQNWMALRPL